MIGILTEKPSAARNFAKALGARKSGSCFTGTFQGEPFLIVHSVGHLYGLVDPRYQVPDAFSGIYGSWDISNLPWDESIFSWRKEAFPKTKDVVTSIKNALSDCSEVVIATDNDPSGEGDLLATEILLENHIVPAKFSRMHFTDEAPATLQKSFIDRSTIPVLTDNGVYCDDGYSAKNTKRPALERLFTDIENHLFDAVIVWKLTRISRNTIDLLKMISFFEKNGVHFVSYSEQFDTGTPVGKLMITLLASIAEFERETISDNVKTALRYRAEKGEPTATQILGYNRKDGFLYINHKEALLVQLIFKEYIKCFNYTEVARRMNKKGYCGKRGKPFRAHQIRIIITNATYCGYNLWERKIIKSHHAPIIKKRTFNRANKGKIHLD